MDGDSTTVVSHSIPRSNSLERHFFHRIFQRMAIALHSVPTFHAAGPCVLAVRRQCRQQTRVADRSGPTRESVPTDNEQGIPVMLHSTGKHNNITLHSKFGRALCKVSVCQFEYISFVSFLLKNNTIIILFFFFILFL